MTEIIQIYQYQCDDCDFVSDSAAYMANHKRYRHTPNDEGRIYSCDICYQTFAFPTAVKQHKDELHNSEVLLPCNYCGLISNSNRNLQRHMRRAHLDPEGHILVKCDYCDKSVQKRSLSRHISKHQQKEVDVNDLKFTCDKCDYKTSTSKYLKMHNINKHPTYLLQCEHCSFFTSYEMRNKRCQNHIHLNFKNYVLINYEKIK